MRASPRSSALGRTLPATWPLLAAFLLACGESEPGGDTGPTGPGPSDPPGTPLPPSPPPQPAPPPAPPPSGSLGPQVTSPSPASHSLSAAATTELTVDFDTPLDPASVGTQTIGVYGRWSGPHTGTVALEQGGMRLRFTPDRPFAAGEQVTVAVSAAVRDTAGEARERSYTWSFWIRTAPGTMNLTRIAERPVRRNGEGWIQTYGAYAGDFDGDGYSDLMAPNEQSNDVRVFLNDGSGDYGSFTVYQIPGGSSPSTNEGADFDRDGVIDFAVGSGNGNLMSVFRGTGGGAFQHSANYTAGAQVRGLCVLDVDSDGAADILTANRTGGNGGGNLSLFRGDGSGGFSSAASFETGTQGETACATADANGDGIMDVFIGSLTSGEVSVLLGDGTGGLRLERTVNALGGPWMIAAGDVNGDGSVDVVSANFNQGTASVLLGDGAGGLLFSQTYPVGTWPVAIDLGDIDGDGDLDLVASNFTTADFTVYENSGAGQFFNRRDMAASTAGSCTILHDRDNDGDLDMTGIDEKDDLLILFRNGS